MNELANNTDRLNDALRDVEDALDSLRLGVLAEVTVTTQPVVMLRFSKVGADWVLSIVQDGGMNMGPLLKASRSHRIAAVDVLPRLLIALRQAYDAQNVEMLQAISTAKAIADAIRNGTAMGSR